MTDEALTNAYNGIVDQAELKVALSALYGAQIGAVGRVGRAEADAFQAAKPWKAHV